MGKISPVPIMSEPMSMEDVFRDLGPREYRSAGSDRLHQVSSRDGLDASGKKCVVAVQGTSDEVKTALEKLGLKATITGDDIEGRSAA